MTDSKALIERLRKWPMREQVQTYDHTFHIAETGSSYTTKQVIPQRPKLVMHEAADHIKKLEAYLMDAQADNAIGIARIAELEAELDRCRKSNVVMDNTVRELEADNARLREALGKIVALEDDFESNAAMTAHEWQMFHTARAALQEPKP